MQNDDTHTHHRQQNNLNAHLLVYYVNDTRVSCGVMLFSRCYINNRKQYLYSINDIFIYIYTHLFINTIILNSLIYFSLGVEEILKDRIRDG